MKVMMQPWEEVPPGGTWVLGGCPSLRECGEGLICGPEPGPSMSLLQVFGASTELLAGAMGVLS